MRIGYFTNTYPRAVDTFIQREVTGLRDRGFEVLTYSVRKTDDIHNVSDLVKAEKASTFYILPVRVLELVYLNFKFLFLSPKRYLKAVKLAVTTGRSGFSGSLYQLYYFLESVVLAKQLLKGDIQHIHNHLGDNSGNVTLFASLLTGISYSITFHGPHVFFDPYGWALAEKVRYSKFIVCISHYCKSQLMLFSDPRDWGRLNIVHCGVDPDKHTNLDVSPMSNRLIYIGRLAVEKGLPILFQSIQKLEEMGHVVTLTLVGDGPDRKHLERLGATLGIDSRLDFVGYAGQDEVIEYLGKSDIFVLPSFAEGVPVSIMEAMSCGVPVVCTYVGGVVELVENEKTGLIVFPSDADGLCEAIARYLCDDKLRRNIIRKAREKIVAEYNINIELDKLAKLLIQ
jgi:colanic acid/amylovoran biosynthesis glycosyltransferase